MSGQAGFNRTGNFKADIPHATIVLRIPASEVDMTKTLIDSYVDELPDQLKEILTAVRYQLSGRL